METKYPAGYLCNHVDYFFVNRLYGFYCFLLVMQGIEASSPHKDFQPPLGIFLPSIEKQIILLEKNIILLGKIPSSNLQAVPSLGTKSTSTGTKNTKPW